MLGWQRQPNTATTYLMLEWGVGRGKYGFATFADRGDNLQLAAGNVWGSALCASACGRLRYLPLLADNLLPNADMATPGSAGLPAGWAAGSRRGVQLGDF
ncbi:hypothetical protein HC891_12500, partial [Candidatus Gracilibacteria bacterium]|nr:hypothetical protein [Candidatus Gracilibacteria bacterium]